VAARRRTQAVSIYALSTFCIPYLRNVALETRLYPFRPHSKAFRLGAPRTPAELLPYWCPRATAEKSHASTTPCVPVPKHRRKSGGFCGTTPSAGRPTCSASLAGEQRGLRARIVPTGPGWSFESPSQTTAAASLPRDADALPGMSFPSASARQTTQGSARGWHQDRCRAKRGWRKRPADLTHQYPAYGHGGQSCAVPDGSSRSHLHSALSTAVPVLSTVAGVQEVLGSSATTERFGRR
jgi:hypothetical protein